VKKLKLAIGHDNRAWLKFNCSIFEWQRYFAH
jgi:hypothetical protein